jgi:hypothetical protein
MRFLTADQKQQSVCEELRQIVSDDTAFLSWVITGDESWIYRYDPEIKQQYSQWKMKSKVKSMNFIFFDMKGAVQKELVLAGQSVSSTYYCDVLRRLRENVRRLRMTSHYMIVVLTFLFPRLKTKLKGRYSDTTEVIEADSQAVLNTLREHYFQDAF